MRLRSHRALGGGRTFYVETGKQRVPVCVHVQRPTLWHRPRLFWGEKTAARLAYVEPGLRISFGDPIGRRP